MKTKLFFMATLLALSFFSCKKNKDNCYDERLYQRHKNDVCTMDCPGVIGCDGKTYCNECMARKQGIKVKISESRITVFRIIFHNTK